MLHIKRVLAAPTTRPVGAVNPVKLVRDWHTNKTLPFYLINDFSHRERERDEIK